MLIDCIDFSKNWSLGGWKWCNNGFYQAGLEERKQQSAVSGQEGSWSRYTKAQSDHCIWQDESHS